MNGKLTPILFNGGTSLLPRYWVLAAIVVLGCLGSMSAGAQQFLPNMIYSSTVPQNGDLNPYGVAFVPPGFPNGSKVNPGDILVSSFNNNNNQQGTGTTIIKL